jgi:hypothetical protein
MASSVATEIRRLRRRNFGDDLELKEDHMATKPMNLNAGLEGLQTLVKTKGTILDRWLADKQEWAPIALRVPLAVIFFAHGAQKMFGWFGGYGWNGTMQYFTQ